MDSDQVGHNMGIKLKPQRMVRDLKFRKKGDCVIYKTKTKGLSKIYAKFNAKTLTVFILRVLALHHLILKQI